MTSIPNYFSLTTLLLVAVFLNNDNGPFVALRVEAQLGGSLAPLACPPNDELRDGSICMEAGQICGWAGMSNENGVETSGSTECTCDATGMTWICTSDMSSSTTSDALNPSGSSTTAPPCPTEDEFGGDGSVCQLAGQTCGWSGMSIENGVETNVSTECMCDDTALIWDCTSDMSSSTTSDALDPAGSSTAAPACPPDGSVCQTAGQTCGTSEMSSKNGVETSGSTECMCDATAMTWVCKSSMSSSTSSDALGSVSKSNGDDSSTITVPGNENDTVGDIADVKTPEVDDASEVKVINTADDSSAPRNFIVYSSTVMVVAVAIAAAAFNL